MLVESAQVVEVSGPEVLIRTVRRNACAGCRVSSGCGQKLLVEAGDPGAVEVLASNPRQLVLQPGDQVAVGIEERSFLQASVALYLLPLCLLIGTAMTAQWFGAAEPLVIVLSMLGLAGGFWVVRRWGQQSDSQCRLQPQILNLQH